MPKTIKINNIEAVTLALTEALERNPKVVLYGQDVGVEGGVFRATKGIQKRFGADRVWDAPISEAAIVGSAIGAAVAGLRPVVEMQFQGFSYTGLQQIINHMTRLYNRSRGVYKVPMVIRMPMGGGIRALEHHSEASESTFASIPGITVVMPSNPYDMRGLLHAAIETEDPVVFLENKKIYRSFKQEVPTDYYKLPLRKAQIIHEGSTITVVSYGAQVHDVLKAMQTLAKTNPEISVELVDLCTIKPFDRETVINSVKKTGRLLVVHEASRSFSVSSEIIAAVNENAFLELLAPPTRLTGYDIIIPYAKGEKYHAINPEKVVCYIKEVCAFTFPEGQK